MADYNVNTLETIKGVLSNLMDDPSAILNEMTCFDRTFNSEPSGSFKKFSSNHIIDEDQTVRWNREEVARLNAEYDEEEKRLKDVKFDARYEFLTALFKSLASEHEISVCEAETIWSYAYGKCHSYGYNDVLCEFEDAAELYNDLRKQCQHD